MIPFPDFDLEDSDNFRSAFLDEETGEIYEGGSVIISLIE